MKKNICKITTLSMASVMALATSAMPLFAATSYEPVNGTSAMFEKYLVMESDANVPGVTFKFTVAPGEAADYDGFSVRAGIGTPTIEDVVFSANDETFDSVQKSPIADPTGAEVDDQVVLAEGEKYARHEAVIDFSSVEFATPGIYRYVVTEDASSDGVFGITNDESASRIVDVYVVNDGVDEESGNPKLKVQGYVMYATEGEVASELEPADKSNSFQNKYDTHNLEFSKEVSGNQASHDQYFMFTVKLEGAAPGCVFNVDLSNADATVGSNEATLDSYENQTNPAELVADEDGNVTAIFYLQHGQSIAIKGISDATKYSVQEAEEDYAPSVVETIGKEAGEAAEANKVENLEDGLKDDTSIAFTNTKSGNIATGVVMKVAPYATVVVVATAGLIVLKMRKKED